jgi:uncharacterized membrane protein
MEPASVEPSVERVIAAIGIVIDGVGVVIIVLGILWATVRFLLRHMGEEHYESYRGRIGRSLLLGLEMLVAADIVKTIALEATFQSLGILAGLVLVRTFLSWSLVLEIDGRWPWQPANTWHEGSNHDRQV